MSTPQILAFGGIAPKIHPSVYLGPNVVIIGDVEIGPESSIWPNAVLRGDMGMIRIGARSNIQDGAVLHMSAGTQGTHVGNDVTVGHMALLHDCRIEDKAFIGMRATVLDGARVESFGMLAAGALLTGGKTVKGYELWAGMPARFLRAIPDDESALLCSRAGEYAALASRARLGETALQNF